MSRGLGRRQAAASRIDSEMARHLGYVNSALEGREFFVGDALSGAIYPDELCRRHGKVFDRIGPYPI